MEEVLKPKSRSFIPTMDWLKKQNKLDVESLGKWYMELGIQKRRAKSLAKSYRYIIDMMNNVNDYKGNK